MFLQSELFRDDDELQAVAVHRRQPLAPGCKGPSVGKIQKALNLLQQAGLRDGGDYDLATANEVLRFNQKRGILNEIYRSRANNVVGQPTLLALDQDILKHEAGGDTASAPRIVDIRPQPPPERRPAFRGPRPVALAPLQKSLVGGARGTAGSIEAIHIDVPPDVPNAIEVLVNQSGAFTVVDGIGGQVRCWDEDIGRLSDPSEPLAHTHPMMILRSPHLFFVQGLKPGNTTIEARPKGKSSAFAGLGDLISFRVLAQSDRLTWRPTWTVKIGPRMTCEPWAAQPFGDGTKVPGVLVQAPLIEFEGTVDPDGSINPAEYELGIMQAVNSSLFMALYQDASGNSWTYKISGAPALARDVADDSTFWYHRTAVKPLSSPGGKTVSTNDRPQTPAPWFTRNKRGALVSTGGFDTFSTWLAARHIATGKLIVLCWADWTVNWSCEFDAKTERRTVHGSGRITGRGADGQGTNAPVQGGKTSIEQTDATWTPDQG